MQADPPTTGSDACNWSEFTLARHNMKLSQAFRVFISRRLQEAKNPTKPSHDRSESRVASLSPNKNQHATANNGSQI